MSGRISSACFLTVSILSVGITLLAHIGVSTHVHGYQEEIESLMDRLDGLESDLERRERAHAEEITRLKCQIRASSSPMTLPIRAPSGMTPRHFEMIFEGTALSGIHVALIDAEKRHGINALILASIIVHETDWGRSELARNRNNLAGLGAYGRGSGMRFESRAHCIDFLAELLSTKYCPGGKFFGGSYDLIGIGKMYAEDPEWARKVAACMGWIIAERSKNDES